MHIVAQPVAVPKRGHTAEEYEDAFWPPRGVSSCGDNVLCAIADGATEASFSGLWARLLVEFWGQRTLTSRMLPHGLHDIQKAWEARVLHRPLPWYAEEKARAGAFAAFVGFGMYDVHGRRRWYSVAVGDSCLFQIREGRLLVAVPLSSPEDFGSSPALLSSRTAANGRLTEALRRSNGSWEAGDEFYLMTDALAAWFLRVFNAAGGVPQIPGIEAEADPEVFRLWIEHLRDRGEIRNDDVTLVALHVE